MSGSSDIVSVLCYEGYCRVYIDIGYIVLDGYMDLLPNMWF
jgi:hypothetical protein